MAVKLQITEENPYPSKLLNYMDYVAVEGMKVFKIPMDITVSCLYLTTEEKKIWYFYLYRFIIIFPIGFMFMVLTMPINILAFALWLTIHKKRKPYRLSYCGTSRRTLEVHKLKRNYGFLTTNVCLMPECMGRFNNFKNSDVRCQKMGEILARKHVTNSKDSHIIDMEEEGVDKNHNKADQNVQSSNILMNNGYSVGSFIHEWSQSSTTIIPEDTGHRVGPDFDVSVLSHMPDVDLILLQEASWDMEYAKTLVSEMHNIYPYVVYDIGMHSYKGNLWVGNSGLMLASKYDILDIRFGLYEQSLPPCWFASKGLLQLKVLISAFKNTKYLKANEGKINLYHVYAVNLYTNMCQKLKDEIIQIHPNLFVLLISFFVCSQVLIALVGLYISQIIYIYKNIYIKYILQS